MVLLLELCLFYLEWSLPLLKLFLLNTKIETVKESVDEVFAFGKEWATRGAVRFKTEDAMWSYLKSEEPEANFKYKGKTMYVNRSVRGSSEEEARTKAVLATDGITPPFNLLARRRDDDEEEEAIGLFTLGWCIHPDGEEVVEVKEEHEGRLQGWCPEEQ